MSQIEPRPLNGNLKTTRAKRGLMVAYPQYVDTETKVVRNKTFPPPPANFLLQKQRYDYVQVFRCCNFSHFSIGNLGIKFRQ